MFLLVPAHSGSPGQKAVKRLCMCVALYIIHFAMQAASRNVSTETAKNETTYDKRYTQLSQPTIKYNKKPTKGLLISAVYVLVLCSSICLSVTSWYCVKTAERIQLIFGGLQATIGVSYNMLER